MKQDLTVNYVPIEQLALYENNARTHTDAQIKQIERSIKIFGFINPVVVDAKNVVVAGHGRLKAAKRLGLSTVPVIHVDHLTEDQVRAYRLADNKTAENAGWDNDLLKIELSALIEVDYDLNITGFSAPEIDTALFTSTLPPETTPPLPPDLADTITQPGDIWLLGLHRIACGDCRDPKLHALLMDGQQARVVLTDPPYNVKINGHVSGLGKHQHDEFAMCCGEMSSEAFTTFLKTSLGLLAKQSMDGALQYIFIDWRHLAEILEAGEAIYESLINLCIWRKNNGGMGSLYRSQHELVFVFRHGSAPHLNNVELGKHGRYRTNVWDYPGVNSFGAGRDEALSMHPTVKPVRLLADAILDSSERGDIVLDGFLGSGSTLMAAEETARVCYGIEFDPRYVDVALKRWIKAAGKQPVQLSSGQTFAALAGSSPAQSQGMG